MKHTWLYSALCAWVLCLLPFSYAWISLCLFLPFLYQRQGKWCSLSLMLFICLYLRMIPQEIIKPSDHMQVKIVERKTNYAIGAWADGKVMLYGETLYGIDDLVEVDVTCEPISTNRNFHQFDFVSYMEKRSISDVCTIQNAELIAHGTSIRAKLWQEIQKQSDPIRSWLNQTLFHLRETETNDLLYSTGMHISLFLRCLAYVLSLYFSPRYRKAICLIVLLLLGVIEGGHDAWLRILIFQSVNWALAQHDGKDRLGMAMLILLGLRPYLANELVFVLPVTFRLTECFQVHKMHRFLKSLLVLLPLQFYYFHEVNICSILLLSLYRYLLMGNFLCAWLYLLFRHHVWYTFAQILLGKVSDLDTFAFWLYGHTALWFVLLWFALLFAYLGNQRKQYAYALLTLLIWTQLSPYIQPYVQVMMLDVGQGDCILISLPFHQGHILIDAPGNETSDIAEKIIVPMLHAQGIRALDLVIITHDDMDHSGSLSRLQELMEVKQVISNKQEDIAFGNFQLHFLLTDQTFSNTNDNSILTYFEAYGVKFLFMGDAGQATEQRLLQEYPNLQADILKVGHHGSKSATSKPFIQQLHPTLALISCGAHNWYGHPHEETLATLKQAEVAILDTPHHGAIQIKITNIFCIYETATHEFGIIKTR